jgi:uncharacterized protein
MEALCRLSYSGGPAMIATALYPPRWDDGAVRWLAVSAVLAALATCSGTDDPLARRGPTSLVTFEGSTAVLYVRIADDAGERRRGLMGVTRLGDDEGMAFVFEAAVEGGFWMKDTLIPLSIAFYDADGRIVRILDMEPCTEDPCPLYDPAVAYRGALEVNRGAFAEWNVREGDHVRLER